MGDHARGEGDFSTAREAYLRATVIDDRSTGAWDGLCTVETELAASHWIAGLASGGPTELGQAANDGGAAGRSCARWGELVRATQEGRARVESDLRVARALAAQGDGAGVRLYLPSHAGDPLLESLVLLADATKKDAAGISAAARAAAMPLAKLPLSTTSLASDVALAGYCAYAADDAKRLDEALAELGRRAPKLAVLDTLKALAPSIAADAGAVDATTDAVVDAADAADAPKAATFEVGPATEDELAGGWRALDERGFRALGNGDPARAEKMFRAALEEHPGDIDATFGLGQVAQARGETANATSYYKQVLDQSPGFAPARLALADVQWGAGQQADAVRNYETYLDRVSEGSGADRARARVAAHKGGGDPKPEPTTTTPPVAPSAPSAPTATGAP
jgi:hypothetical protein